MDNNMNSSNLDTNVEQNSVDSELLKIRRAKLEDLKQTGQDPFLITKFGTNKQISEIKNNFEELLEQEVKIAGRIVSWRDMGKVSFIDLQGDDKIQLYFKLENLPPEQHENFTKWDIGDIIGVCGNVFKTRRGEISVRVTSCELLAKSLLPLPEKFHGLKDTDLRYRQRYLDLIMDSEVKNTFIIRSKVIKAIREFLDSKGFLEVETPILQNVAGGAAARPFVTHHNALNMEMFLRIALELYLKRLIVGGIDKVYELGRVFRNEGISIRHNPEFTELELYEAYKDYEGIMQLTEEMLKFVAQKVLGTTKIKYGEVNLDLSRPFERITMVDAVKKYSGVDFDDIKDLQAARKAADEHNISYKAEHLKGDILNLFFEEFAEKHLISPTFVIDYPVEISPLAKRKPTNPDYTERFELFIVGREYANAFSELNDPVDQRQRFMRQLQLRQAGDMEANLPDEDFVTALEYGMPPTGGLGVGIDRLVMLLTNSESIRDVLFFPTMKSLDK